MTPSCTQALELSAMLLNVGPGDEVIVPSFTFVSTASAFALRGASLVFVDVRPDTMNMDEQKVAEAISPKTKVIVPVHYAGVACEMDAILSLAQEHSVSVVEDAAQAIDSFYKGKALGSIGDMGCFSFHETKNITCGEGGALCINDKKYVEDAEIAQEKGTNRKNVLSGQVDKYTWVALGSSHLLGELPAAYLWGQLENIEIIQQSRRKAWEGYGQGLKHLETRGFIELPVIPEHCTNNAHMFYIKVKNLTERNKLFDFLKENNIQSASHYVPLHSSPMGKKYGRMHGEDVYTTRESERLLRLPIFFGLTEGQVNRVVDRVQTFFKR